MGGFVGRWGMARRQPEAFRSENDGSWRSEQRRQQVGKPHAAALGGARDAREYLMGVRPRLRAVARGHLTYEDRRPNLALREAVGRRNRRVVQEGEHLGLVRLEVLAKSSVVRL